MLILRLSKSEDQAFPDIHHSKVFSSVQLTEHTGRTMIPCSRVLFNDTLFKFRLMVEINLCIEINYENLKCVLKRLTCKSYICSPNKQLVCQNSEN